jgi:chromosome segregation ATPase
VKDLRDIMTSLYDDLEVESAIAVASEERYLRSQMQISALESEAASLRAANQALLTTTEKEKRSLSSALARALSDAELIQESTSAERTRLSLDLAAANNKIDSQDTEHLKELGRFRTLLQLETTRASSLENEVHALRMERDSLRVSVSEQEEARKRDSDELLKSTRSLELEIAGLKRRSLMFESEASSSKSRYTDASTRLSNLSVELAIIKSEATSREAALESDLRIAKSKVSALESTLEQVKVSTSSELSLLKKRAELAEYDLREVLNEKSALEKMLQHHRQSEEEAISKSRDYEAELEALRARVLAPQPVSFESHVTRSSLMSSSRLGASRSLGPSSSRIQNSGENTNYNSMDNDMNTINSVSDLALVQGECEGLRRALTELRAREASLTSQLSVSSTQATDLHRKVMSAEARAREAEGRVKILEGQVRSEHDDVKELSRECAKLRETCATRLDELRNAEQALLVANDEVIYANEAARMFKKKAYDIKKKLISLFGLYQDLKTQVIDATQARDFARGAREADIERLQRELLHERSRIVEH